MVSTIAFDRNRIIDISIPNTEILQVRCNEEDVEMTTDALELLTRIASETSLRYALHLIITSSLVANKKRRKVVELQDIKRCYKLFIDVKRSTKFLFDYQNEFMFNELSSKTTPTLTTTMENSLETTTTTTKQQQKENNENDNNSNSNKDDSNNDKEKQKEIKNTNDKTDAIMMEE